MNYTALYRKYRPETFEEVIGQDHIVNTLKNQIKTDKISHAYLFTGTRGTGKTSTAKILAKAVNCLSPVDGNPCLKCDCCKMLSTNNMDVIEMDAASNNGVDYARDIREKVQYLPHSCRFKVYIIDEVHMLSQGAFNALLKTIEEPPAHMIFILCTTEAHKIPATILSRTMRFDFKLVPTELLAKHIAHIFDLEGKKYENDAINAIAVAGEGSVRDSITIADRCFSLNSKKLTYNDVLEVLGVSSTEIVADLAEAILLGEINKIFEISNNLLKLGKDVGRLNRDLCRFFRDLLVTKTCEDSAQSLLTLPTQYFDRLSEISTKTTLQKLLFAVNCLSTLETELRFALSPAMLFEAVVLKIATSTGEVDTTQLERRISALERNSDKPTNMPIIVDKTNYKSIWLATKVEISQMNKPLLLALWKEVEGVLVGETLTLNCSKTQFNLLEEEYKPVLEKILHRFGVNLKVVEIKQTADDIDTQLKNLGEDVKIK